MKKAILLTMALGLTLQQQAKAQKHVDLQLSVLSPEPQTMIPYGETVHLIYSITNLGPDDLEATDTLYVQIADAPGVSMINVELPANTSLTDTLLTVQNHNSTTDTAAYCAYIRSDWHTAIIDSIQVNDTICFDFILVGENTGIELANSAENFIELYPNPATTWLSVNLHGRFGKVDKLRITDVSGRVIMSRDIPSNPIGPLRFNINHYSPGMYFVTVWTGQGTIREKFLVQ